MKCHLTARRRMSGIQVNDLIISVDNKRAISALETMDQVTGLRPGSVIPVVVMRDDKRLTLQSPFRNIRQPIKSSAQNKKPESVLRFFIIR